jgi:hypothetical protein
MPDVSILNVLLCGQKIGILVGSAVFVKLPARTLGRSCNDPVRTVSAHSSTTIATSYLMSDRRLNMKKESRLSEVILGHLER